MAKINGYLKRGSVFLILAFVMVLATLTISELAYRQANGGLGELSRLDAARMTLLNLVQRITDAETAQRGYIITRRDEYMGPYHLATADVREALVTLRQIYADSGIESAQTLWHRLDDDVMEKLVELDGVLALMASQRPEDASEAILAGLGLRQMERIRTDAAELQVLQSNLFDRNLDDVFSTLSLSRIGVSLMIVIIFLMLVHFRRQSRLIDDQRLAKEFAIKAERDQLEAVVRRRTLELTELARHLQLAREDERSHLARELHDELGALLTAAKMDLARLRPRFEGVSDDLSERLAHLTDTLNTVIVLKRRIIEDLRPSTLDNLGLCPALDILCRDFSQRTDVAVHTDLKPVRLSSNAQLTVFRVVQEALTNISKYANAKNVHVMLYEGGDSAWLRVSDDGAGFEPLGTSPTRYGLRGMRFRVEAERGVLVISSAPGSGTLIEARLPLAGSDGVEHAA